MASSKKIVITEYVFSRNIDFWKTPLSEVKEEHLKKKVQLNLVLNSKNFSTEKLQNYILKLEEYIEENSIDENEVLAQEKIQTDYKDSMRICNLLIGSSIFMFIVFGTFGILAKSFQLGIIGIINLFVFGIIILYRKTKTKSITNI